MDANSAIGAADVGQLGAPRYLDHIRSEEHTSELQSRLHLVCRLLLEKKKILFISCTLVLLVLFTIPLILSGLIVILLDSLTFQLLLLWISITNILKPR